MLMQDCFAPSPFQALALLDRMKSGGVQRTPVTFDSALLACAKVSGDSEQYPGGFDGDDLAVALWGAFFFFKSTLHMVKVLDFIGTAEVTRRDFCRHGPVSDIDQKAGRRTEALRLLTEMREEEVPLDEKAFRLAIQACG